MPGFDLLAKGDDDVEYISNESPVEMSPTARQSHQRKKRTEHSRIESLDLDSQVDSYDPTHVWCKFCNRKIGTGGNYNLGSWNSHKLSCKAPMYVCSC